MAESEMSSHSHRLYYADLPNSPITGGNYNDVTVEWGASKGFDGVSTNVVGGSQSHIHSFIGSSGNGSSLPSYYALAMIMRLS